MWNTANIVHLQFVLWYILLQSFRKNQNGVKIFVIKLVISVTEGHVLCTNLCVNPFTHSDRTFSLTQVSLSEDGGLGSMLEHTGGDGPPAIAADIFLLNMQYVLNIYI